MTGSQFMSMGTTCCVVRRVMACLHLETETLRSLHLFKPHRLDLIDHVHES